MPKSSLQRQEFGSKKPYLVASVFSLALVIFAIYVAEKRIGDVFRTKAAELQAPLAKLTKDNQALQTVLGSRGDQKTKADNLKSLADTRFFWIVVLQDLRKVLIQAEAAEKASLTTPDNGGTNTDEGLWVESFSPVMPDGYQPGMQDRSAGSGSSRSGFLRGGRYGGRLGMPGPPSSSPTPTATVTSRAMPALALSAVEVTNVQLTLRGINRPGRANSDLAYMFRQFLTNNPSFTNPVTMPEVKIEGDTNTFTFDVTVNLAKHFNLK
jgi:hypothetical protein